METLIRRPEIAPRRRRVERASRPGAGLRPTRLCGLVFCGLVFAQLGVGCATGPEEIPAAEARRLRAEQIVALEAAIDRDHRALEDLVTRPRDEQTPPFHEDEDLRAIAERITSDSRQLETLRREESEQADER